MQKSLSLNLPFPISSPLILKKKFSLRIFWFLSFLLIFGLLIFYVFQINSIIEKTYLSQSYEKKLKELEEKNRNLEIEFVKTNSLENLEILVKNLNFEKAEKIRYIKVLPEQVVTK